uniref:ArfGAP with RhoGAP domain, ankyrin repeat and PH domain 3 n=1 Tax=Xiphophorus maculatus TaxID=8083 RepID=M4AKQ6_XIPMA
MATLDGSSAAAMWHPLTLRHRLTFSATPCRYLDTFRRAGLLLARDCAHLDHDALVSLGVAATGHRKRILRLVSLIQRREAQRANQSAGLPCDPSQEGSIATSRRRALAPGSAASLDRRNGPAMKPVPKPRTVFNRRRTAPVQFSTAPDVAAPADRRLSQESICFTVLEGSLDGTRLSGSSGSPGGGSMEMVSNEIYWGTNPSSAAPSGGRSYCSQQAAPPTPPRNPDQNQNLDRNRWVSRIHACYMRVSVRSDTDRLSQAFLSGDAPGFSAVGEAPPPLRCSSFPPEADDDLTISPYASYASLTERAPPIISGCLDKLSPQGNYVFQKRFVKFDGKNLMYFGSEKDVYPKGVIPLAAIQMARPAKDNKFEIVTSHRIFVFRTENETLRRRWVATLQEHVRDHQVFGRRRFGPGSHCQKHGALELKGTKSRVYAAINTDQIWLHKSEQCFRNGIGITVIEARGATIRDGKHRSFDLITPYKTFSFTAESDRDKRDWMEALQEAIAETLSDYEVAEKIWSNRSNRTCADCKAQNPDWASINLCVVICKNCAGQHRGLGTMVSKVQSLKLDTSVWSNEIVQLFIMLGNDRANDFWAARLPVSEELDRDASPEQRRDFITQKYREGRFRRVHPAFSGQEELLKVLCSAVSEQTLLKTVTQIFLEAARLADPSVYDEIMQPVLHSGFLYKASSLSRGTLSRKTREGRTTPEERTFWCSVDRSLVLYESDHSAEPWLRLNTTVLLGPILTTADELHSWTKAIGQAATPLSCHCLLTREFERVGLLRYRAMLDPQQWKEAYFVLQKSNLFVCPRTDGAAEDIVNLNRLQELSITSESENQEKKDILVLVEKGRTLHLQGVCRSDFSLWLLDIRQAAGGKGNALREQQMSRNDIPIIVDSCIAFITQYGLQTILSFIAIIFETINRSAKFVIVTGLFIHL